METKRAATGEGLPRGKPTPREGVRPAKLYPFRSAAFGAYLSHSPDATKLCKGKFAVTESLWELAGTAGMRHHASRATWRIFPVRRGEGPSGGESWRGGEGVELLTLSGLPVDAHGEGPTVRVWERRNGHPNQAWVMAEVEPPDAHPERLHYTSRVSASPRVAEAILSDPGRTDSVRVHYDSRAARSGHEAVAMLRFVPAVCTDGDSNVVAPDGRDVSLRGGVASPGQGIALLGPEERRRARRVVVSSVNRVFASGGCGGSRFRAHPHPWRAVIVSAAGPQFEVDHLEVVDLVVRPSDSGGERIPLPWYRRGAREGEGERGGGRRHGVGPDPGDGLRRGPTSSTSKPTGRRAGATSRCACPPSRMRWRRRPDETGRGGSG